MTIVGGVPSKTKSIIIIGPMGAGKSTIARLLAKLLVHKHNARPPQTLISADHMTPFKPSILRTDKVKICVPVL
jgi:tRNA A37 threonylcarbamoyladenosine biosynthesis protein TsaE